MTEERKKSNIKGDERRVRGAAINFHFGINYALCWSKKTPGQENLMDQKIWKKERKKSSSGKKFVRLFSVDRSLCRSADWNQLSVDCGLFTRTSEKLEYKIFWPTQLLLQIFIYFILDFFPQFTEILVADLVMILFSRLLISSLLNCGRFSARWCCCGAINDQLVIARVSGFTRK